MSDARLRALERRRATESSVEVEAARLCERARMGQLSLERLELAAFCGDARAIAALGQALESSGDLLGWVRSVSRWGDEVLVRCAIAAARYASRAYLRLEPADLTCSEAITAAEAWCSIGGRETAVRAHRAYLAAADAANAFRARHATDGLRETGARYHEHRLALYGAWSAAYAAAAAACDVSGAPYSRPAEAAASAVHRAAALPGMEVGRPTGNIDAVLRSIQRELIDFALGDPR